MGKATKHFNTEELVSKQVFDVIGDDAIKLFDPKALETLEAIREILNVPLICNNWKSGGTRDDCGYRDLKCKIGAKNSMHCFDQNTELLTNHGWKTYKKIKPLDLVASLNTETDKIEFVPIERIIQYNYTGNLIYVDNKHVQCAVTDEHRMYVRSKSQKYKRKTDRELTDKAKRYYDSLKSNNDQYHFEYAKDIVHKRREFKCAGVSSHNNIYDVDLLRMCMAAIADGSIVQKQNENSFSIRFNLKKERDKQELEDILAKLGWAYSKKYSVNHEKIGRCGVYSYNVSVVDAVEIKQIIGFDKKIPFWFLFLSPDILRQLVITYAKFDGSIDTRNSNSNITIFSKDEDNIDMLQSMCVLSNMRCVKRTFTNYAVEIGDVKTVIPKFFHLYITQDSNCSSISEKSSKKFFYNALVWCVTNKNGTVISRRNGKVSIQGNCKGMAFDLISPRMTAKEMRDKLDENKDLLIHPIRVEKWQGKKDEDHEISWLHIDVGDTKGEKIYWFLA